MLQSIICPSNLTIVWGCYQGGVETALNYRLKYMNAAGIKSHCFFYYPGMGLSNYYSIPHHISSQKEALVDYIQHHRFECITFINTLHNFDALQDLNYKGKVIYELHGYSGFLVNELQRINQGEDGGRIDAVVAPSAPVAEWVRKLLDQRPDMEIYIAVNTLDTVQFRRRERLHDFMLTYQLGTDWMNSPLIGWVGRLDANKNWGLLLNIVQTIRKKHPAAKLLIASDLSISPDLHLFYKKAAKRGLIKSVRILQNLSHEQMPLYYSLIAESGGVLLSTSYSEGYPYNLMEAQACECPVVCSDIEGSREVVEHAVTGFTFPLSESQAAAAAADKLMTSQQLRSEIINNARQQVTVRNDIHRNVYAYIEWLTRLRMPRQEEQQIGKGGSHV